MLTLQSRHGINPTFLYSLCWRNQHFLYIEKSMECTYQTNPHWSEPPASTEPYMAIYAPQILPSSSSSAFPCLSFFGRVFSLFLPAHPFWHSAICTVVIVGSLSSILHFCGCALQADCHSPVFHMPTPEVLLFSSVSALKEPSEEEGSIAPIQAKPSHLSTLLDPSESLPERPPTHLHLARNLVTDWE